MLSQTIFNASICVQTFILYKEDKEGRRKQISSSNVEGCHHLSKSNIRINEIESQIIMQSSNS